MNSTRPESFETRYVESYPTFDENTILTKSEAKNFSQ